MLTPEVLGRTLATAPDPELARVALSRIGEDPRARDVLGRDDVLPLAVRLLGFSTATTDFLVAHPDEAQAFLQRRRACGHSVACLTSAYRARIVQLHRGIDSVMDDYSRMQNGN